MTNQSIQYSETIVRAFGYFATSRTLHHRLREDYQLPSIRVLTRWTSIVINSGDNGFIENVLLKLDTVQKHCLLLIDEIYVKPTLSYHGGTLFGKSVNNPVAGYITRKDKSCEDSFIYYENFGTLIDDLNRGKQWLFSYIMFQVVADFLMNISEMCNFNIKIGHRLQCQRYS